MDKTDKFIKNWDSQIKEWFLKVNKTDVYIKYLSGFQTTEMLEPYWGTPKCSIAILNLNPGFDRNRTHEQEEMFNAIMDLIKEKGYSPIALQFPYYQHNKELEKNGLGMFIGYNGTKWWQSRRPWIEHIIKATDKNVGDRLPFALELCPWHSINWNSKQFIDSLKEQEFKNHIEANVISIFEEAIFNSKCKIGICIGKSFGKILETYGYFNITNTYYPHSNDDGIQLIPSVKRYYRIYKKGETIILNTWHKGGNRIPNVKFWDREEKLIANVIKSII